MISPLGEKGRNSKTLPRKFYKITSLSLPKMGINFLRDGSPNNFPRSSSRSSGEDQCHCPG
eukprot:12453546-Prorocentrum_lima.AAC.1